MASKKLNKEQSAIAEKWVLWGIENAATLEQIREKLCDEGGVDITVEALFKRRKSILKQRRKQANLEDLLTAHLQRLEAHLRTVIAEGDSNKDKAGALKLLQDFLLHDRVKQVMTDDKMLHTEEFAMDAPEKDVKDGDEVVEETADV